MQTVNDVDATCINTIRTLSMDSVQTTNSGHPAAPIALTAQDQSAKDPKSKTDRPSTR